MKEFDYKKLDASEIATKITTSHIHIVALNQTDKKELFTIYKDGEPIRNNYKHYYEADIKTTNNVEYEVVPHVSCLVIYLVGEEE